MDMAVSGQVSYSPPDDFRVVQATGPDREWAAQLMVRSEPWTTLRRPIESCRAVLNDPEFQVFVARVGAERGGFLVLDPRGVAGAPYLKSVAIAPEFRGHGLGSRLIAFAEQFFRPRARHLFLCVSSFNESAKRLYERLGYEAVGSVKDLAIEGASELLMFKRL
jgi:ribosomal protein S18 acetylase RimI-like enzyme